MNIFTKQKFYKHLWRNTAFIILIFLFATILMGCSKMFGKSISDDPLVPIYSQPVWHPDGQLIGFNHISAQNMANNFADSNGFWTINKNGTGFRKLTTFALDHPAWSPDGKWIAFCNYSAIYKMSFDGNNFDTAHKIKLTTSGDNFYPSWSADGRTIFYQSNQNPVDALDLFSVWKMSADGEDKTQITDTTGGERVLQPFCTNTNLVLHIRYRNGHPQLFSMDTEGKNVKQLTYNVDAHDDKQTPGYFDGQVFYEGYGIWSVTPVSFTVRQLCNKSVEGYSISKDGIIAYVNFDQTAINATEGTIWLMDTNGNNKRQLTYNK